MIFVRLLVIEYVKRRITLGAKFHGVDWTSLKSLPGPHDKCKRRMSHLMRNRLFRKSVMKLCNMLSEYTNDMNIEERWDDFENKDIKMILDEVLKYKQVDKLEVPKDAQYVSKFPQSNVVVGAEGHVRLVPFRSKSFFSYENCKKMLDKKEKTIWTLIFS